MAINEKFNKEVISSSFFILNQMLKLASSIIGIIFIAYIIGYFRLTSYYRCFDCKWIVMDLSPIEFLSASIFSIFWIVIFIILGITDVAEGLSIKSMYKFITIIMILTILIYISSEILLSNDKIKMSIQLLRIAAVLWAIICGMMINEIVQILKHHKFEWTSPLVFSFLFTVSYGLYFSPKAIGKSEGLRDSNINYSTLPIVRTIESNNDNWRLLTTNNNLFYLFRVDSTEVKKIKIVDYNSILFIQDRIDK